VGHYIVGIKQIYVKPVLIEADSDEEAVLKVQAGEGDRDIMDEEYVDTLQSYQWDVYKTEGKSDGA
jgi:hypothetical protein